MIPSHRLSRRDFFADSISLAGAAALTSAIPLSIAAASEPTKSVVTYGFSLYGMRSLKTAEALGVVAKIGYDAVELVCNAGWPSDPAALNAAARSDIRKALQESGMVLTAMMENLNSLADAAGHRQNLDRLQAAMELGRTLSPEATPVVETILGGKPDQWESARDAMAKALSDWAVLAEKKKVVLAVKPHVGGALHTPDGARWLIEKVDNPWLRLTYDFSHYRLREFDMAETLKTLLPLTAFIHVKDARGGPGQFQFLLPGEGDIDYVKYFQILREAGYRGSVMVEVSGQLSGKPGYDPIDAAKRSYEGVAGAFEKAGLRRSRP